MLSKGKDDPFAADKKKTIDYSKVDIHKEPKDFEEALVIAKVQVAKKRQEEHEVWLEHKNVLEQSLIILCLPLTVLQSLWVWIWKKSKTKTEPMLLYHTEVLHVDE